MDGTFKLILFKFIFFYSNKKNYKRGEVIRSAALVESTIMSENQKTHEKNQQIHPKQTSIHKSAVRIRRPFN